MPPLPALLSLSLREPSGLSWQLLSHRSPGNVGVSGKLLEQWDDPGCCLPQQGVIQHDLMHTPSSQPHRFCIPTTHCWGKLRHRGTLPGTTTHIVHSPHSNPTPAWLQPSLSRIRPARRATSPVLSPTTADPQSCAQMSSVLSPTLLSVQRGCQAQECHTAPIPACLAARVHTCVQKSRL